MIVNNVKKFINDVLYKNICISIRQNESVKFQRFSGFYAGLIGIGQNIYKIAITLSIWVAGSHLPECNSILRCVLTLAL